MAGRFRLSYSPQYILANLEFVDLIDDRYKAALHEHKDAILPALKIVATNHTGRPGLNACCILLELGEIVGTQGLVERVQGTDREARRVAMERLSHLPFRSDLGGYQVPWTKRRCSPQYSRICNPRTNGSPISRSKLSKS
jgi:hypothetical protein